MEISLLPDEKVEDLMVSGFKIIQSANLYRFTSDAVLLSRFATLGAKNVLDVCAGSGIVGLHYFALARESACEPDSLTFAEVQPELAEMCRKSVAVNAIEDKTTVITGLLQDFDGNGKFDLVLCNPPYKKANSGYISQKTHLAVARSEVLCTFDDIAKCATKALKVGGRLCFCHKPERLTDVILSLTSHGLTPSRLQYVSAKDKEEPYLFLMEAVKGKKLQLKTLKTLQNTADNFRGD